MNTTNTYVIKCDECKRPIGRTENIKESYAGGTCLTCQRKEPNMDTTTTFTKGPWKWTREKIGEEWHCFLKGEPNQHNDRLVTAMRLDLAAFPYAINTPNARLLEAAPTMLQALESIANNTCCGSCQEAALVAQAAIAKARA